MMEDLYGVKTEIFSDSCGNRGRIQKMDPILNWLNGLSAFMVVIGVWLYAILNMKRYIELKEVVQIAFCPRIGL